MVCTLSLAYFLHLPPFHWWSLTTNQHLRSLPWTTPLIDCFTSMSIPSHTHLPTINPSFEPTTMLYPQTPSFKPAHPYFLTVTMTISLATTSFHLVVPHSSLECNMHLPPPSSYGHAIHRLQHSGQTHIHPCMWQPLTM